jgi:hypothetical protein
MRSHLLRAVAGTAAASSGINYVSSNLRMHLDANSYSGSGDWLDATSNNNDGTIVGDSITYTAVSGSTGAYFTFTGTNDHRIDITDSTSGSGLNTTTLMNGSNNFSINIWFNTTSFPASTTYTISPMILNIGRREIFIVHGDNVATNEVGVSGNNGSWGNFVKSGTLSTGVWYNLCFTFNSSNGHVLYMNAQSVDTNSSTAAFSNFNSSDTNIGGESAHSGNRAYNGKVALVSIYEDTLTSTEVTQNWNAFKGRFGY